MTPLYYEGQTVEIAYEDDADLSGATCSIVIDEYLGPLNLPSKQTTISNALIHKTDGKAYYRATFDPGFYTYRFSVTMHATTGIAEGRFNVA